MTAPLPEVPATERPALYVVPDDERAPIEVMEARENDQAHHATAEPPIARPVLEPARRVSPDLFWLALWGPAGVLGLIGLLATVLIATLGVAGTFVLAAVLVWACIAVFTRQALGSSDRHPERAEDECR